MAPAVRRSSRGSCRIALLATALVAGCAPPAPEPRDAPDSTATALPPGIAAQLTTLQRLYVNAHQHPDSTPLWEDWDCERQRLQRYWVDSSDASKWITIAHRRVEATEITGRQQAAARDAMARRVFFGPYESYCAEAARAGRLGDTVWLPLTVFSDQKARRDSVEKSRRDSAARPPPDSSDPQP